MLPFLAVGMGGFVGACSRYAIIKATQSLTPIFPFGTLISNVIAGFLIGFIIGIEQQSVTLNPNVKLLLTTGFLGGLSTFSTFNIDTILMFQNGRYISAIGNIALNLILTLIFCALGLSIAKWIVARV